jgi:hypothetical protein
MHTYAADKLDLDSFVHELFAVAHANGYLE